MIAFCFLVGRDGLTICWNVLKMQGAVLAMHMSPLSEEARA